MPDSIEVEQNVLDASIHESLGRAASRIPGDEPDPVGGQLPVQAAVPSVVVVWTVKVRELVVQGLTRDAARRHQLQNVPGDTPAGCEIQAQIENAAGGPGEIELVERSLVFEDVGAGHLVVFGQVEPWAEDVTTAHRLIADGPALRAVPAVEEGDREGR